MVSKPPVHGPLHPVGIDIGHDDRLGAQHLAHGAAQQTDSAGAQDEHDGVLGQASAVAGVQGDAERLDQGAHLEGQVGGQLVDEARRVGDDLLQGALGVGEGLGGTAEGHGAADVVAALAAQLARLAREADLEGDVVAGLQQVRLSHSGADGRDDAGRLVAQGQGLFDEDVAVAVVAEVVQVGTAEAGGLDGDEDVVGGEIGEGSFFLLGEEGEEEC